MSNGEITVRMKIKRDIWAEVKAKATREEKSAGVAASELITLGLKGEGREVT